MRQLLPCGYIAGRAMKNKCYSELSKILDYEERFEYLKIGGAVGVATFGGNRWLNQLFYHDDAWKSVCRKIKIRDNFCDMGHPDYELKSRILVHHIDPITKEDILNRSDKLFDPENLITVSFLTHQAIHYGDFDLLPKGPAERSPFDTCPWR